MILGIVGHGQEKFSPEKEALARDVIRDAISQYHATEIISGRSPLGGVDLYAEEIAAELNLPTRIFPALSPGWEGPSGYRARNLRIAAASDLVLCIVVAVLPKGYRGGIAYETCYHCGNRNPPHVKSGGCWTAWKSKARAWRIL